MYVNGYFYHRIARPLECLHLILNHRKTTNILTLLFNTDPTYT